MRFGTLQQDEVTSIGFLAELVRAGSGTGQRRLAVQGTCRAMCAHLWPAPPDGPRVAGLLM